MLLFAPAQLTMWCGVPEDAQDGRIVTRRKYWPALDFEPIGRVGTRAGRSESARAL